MSVPSVCRVASNGFVLNVSPKRTRAQLANSLNTLHKVNVGVKIGNEGLEVGQENREYLKEIRQGLDRVGVFNLPHVRPSRPQLQFDDNFSSYDGVGQTTTTITVLLEPKPDPLPLPTPHFVGRADELDKVVGLLVSGKPPSILLYGSGGIGKTGAPRFLGPARSSVLSSVTMAHSPDAQSP